MVNRKRNIQKSLMVITAAIMVISGSIYLQYIGDYKEAERSYDQISKIAYAEIQSITEDARLLAIDHESLDAMNEDYIAWIEVEGTDIKYPIVQGVDNQFYLRRGFDKNWLISGTVFMEYRNSPDFSDSNTMIYGHHMKDGSMFKSLSSYLNEDFFINNRSVIINAPDVEQYYKVFAVYEAKASSIDYRPGNLSEAEMIDYISGLESISKYFSDEVFNMPGIQILTLVTCGYSIEDARIVVHAFKTDEPPAVN